MGGATPEHRRYQHTAAGHAQLERLYREHHARVFRAAYRVTGDATDAEDVLQTVFLRLARRGFYDGLVFHRVAPGFVIQGGDPRGDGNGGPGYALRCEISQRPYGRGSVGMALSGKDTGGSQFFVNTVHNAYLDWFSPGASKHPVFGKVIEGMDVVHKIENVRTDPNDRDALLLGPRGRRFGSKPSSAWA